MLCHLRSQKCLPGHYLKELGMDQMSIICILKLNLKLFLYRIQIKQQLIANNEKTRVDMCNWFNDKMEENQEWIDKVWFSDNIRNESYRKLCSQAD